MDKNKVSKSNKTKKERVEKYTKTKNLSIDKVDPILEITNHLNDSDKQFLAIQGAQGSGKTSTITAAIHLSWKRWSIFMVGILIIFGPLIMLFGGMKKYNLALAKFRKPKYIQVNLWTLFNDFELGATTNNVSINKFAIDIKSMKTTIWKTIFLKLNIFKNIHSIFILGFELDGLDSKKKVSSLNLFVFFLTMLPIIVFVPLIILYGESKISWPETFLSPFGAVLTSLVSYQIMTVRIRRNSNDLYKDGFDIAIIKRVLEKKSLRRKIVMHIFDLDRLDPKFYEPILKELSIIYQNPNTNILFEVTPDVMTKMKATIKVTIEELNVKNSGPTIEGSKLNDYSFDEFHKIIPNLVMVKSLNEEGLKTIFDEVELERDFKPYSKGIFDELGKVAHSTKMLSYRHSTKLIENFNKFKGYSSWKENIYHTDSYKSFFAKFIFGADIQVGGEDLTNVKIFKNDKGKWDSDTFYYFHNSDEIKNLIESFNEFKVEDPKYMNSILSYSLFPNELFEQIVSLKNSDFFSLIYKKIQTEELMKLIAEVPSELYFSFTDIFSDIDDNRFLSLFIGDKTLDGDAKKNEPLLKAMLISIKSSDSFVWQRVILSFAGELNNDRKFEFSRFVLEKMKENEVIEEVFVYALNNSESFERIPYDKLSIRQRNIYLKMFEGKLDSIRNVTRVLDDLKEKKSIEKITKLLIEVSDGIFDAILDYALYENNPLFYFKILFEANELSRLKIQILEEFMERRKDKLTQQMFANIEKISINISEEFRELLITYLPLKVIEKNLELFNDLLFVTSDMHVAVLLKRTRDYLPLYEMLLDNLYRRGNLFSEVDFIEEINYINEKLSSANFMLPKFLFELITPEIDNGKWKLEIQGYDEGILYSQMEMANKYGAIKNAKTINQIIKLVNKSKEYGIEFNSYFNGEEAESVDLSNLKKNISDFETQWKSKVFVGDMNYVKKNKTSLEKYTKLLNLIESNPTLKKIYNDMASSKSLFTGSKLYKMFWELNKLEKSNLVTVDSEYFQDIFKERVSFDIYYKNKNNTASFYGKFWSDCKITISKTNGRQKIETTKKNDISDLLEKLNNDLNFKDSVNLFFDGKDKDNKRIFWIEFTKDYEFRSATDAAKLLAGGDQQAIGLFKEKSSKKLIKDYWE